jgi:hypothetical protein
MCPDCIPVIAVAIVAATPLSVIKALLAHTAGRIATPGKTTVVSPQANRAPEGRLAWRVVRRPQGASVEIRLRDPRSQKRDLGHPSVSPLEFGR